MRIFETEFLEHSAIVSLTIDLEGEVYTINRAYVYPHYPQNNRSAEPYTFTMTDGVPRWVSNHRVPPSDSIAEMCINRISGFNLLHTEWARNQDTDAFLTEYRRLSRTPSDEEMF